MRIAVYGATGTLGRAVTTRLNRLGAELRLAGRRPDALTPLAAACRSADVAAARLDDAVALASALKGCTVVVNCAPAEASAEPLVRAALAGGLHYVDAGGEQHVIAQLFATFGEAAATRGLTVVPAMGFDYALGDSLARLAARGLEPLDDIVIGYCIEGDDVSANSASAAATTTAGHEVIYREGQWRPVPFELDRGSMQFPEPVGLRQMSRYGSGEVITVPRHTKTRRVRTLITSTSLCPRPALLPVFPVLRPLVGLVRRTPLRLLLRLLASRAPQRQQPSDKAASTPPAAPADAPSAGNRRFTIVVDATAADGRRRRAVARGGNFHEVTAAVLAHGAWWLAKAPAPRGVQSPAAAFGPEKVLDALTDEGVMWWADASAPARSTR